MQGRGDPSERATCIRNLDTRRTPRCRSRLVPHHGIAPAVMGRARLKRIPALPFRQRDEHHPGARTPGVRRHSTDLATSGIAEARRIELGSGKMADEMIQQHVS